MHYAQDAKLDDEVLESQRISSLHDFWHAHCICTAFVFGRAQCLTDLEAVAFCSTPCSGADLQKCSAPASEAF
eukprot:454727-Amphidinium_carterae.1